MGFSSWWNNPRPDKWKRDLIEAEEAAEKAKKSEALPQTLMFNRKEIEAMGFHSADAYLNALKGPLGIGIDSRVVSRIRGLFA